ncbi:glycosyl transferase family 2 [Prochlorothrix hollandica PCC 9006 = CALU 1027]|uniref:Glycosyl transferase family 2 n=2 Tax=Prochlorothrix hollandica TaxID=1223 RepID=A0A0M2Q2L3_PROHO|nr:glycosyl transferase family 2 [Prochlorothrix hollandica PCC 9006 = CALU 1027]
MLILDVSGSMHGTPIDELNRGVEQFIDSVLEDDFASFSVDLGVITFGGNVKTILPIQPIQEAKVPVLETSGNTPMGEAVTQAIIELDARKKMYKSTGVSYYQPWIVLMTDGAPTDTYKAASKKLKDLANSKKIVVIAIGIGKKCNLDLLSEFCADGSEPKRLDGVKFSEFFTWLSQSMTEVVTKSTPGMKYIVTQSTDGWEALEEDNF